MYLAVGDRATMCRYEEAIQRSSGNDALCEAYGYTDNNFQCVWLAQLDLLIRCNSLAG